MKLGKIFTMLLAVILFVACSANTGGTEPEEDELETQGEESGIKVEKGLLNVELTLPASIIDEEELAKIEAQMQEVEGSEIVKKDDGSFTVKMSKKDHKKMLAEMKDDVIQMIDEIREDEDYVSIQDITYNKDFSKMTIIVSDEETFDNSFDAFATMGVGFSGLLYQVFSGKDITKEKVTIQLEDATTNEIFHEIIYPDVLKDMEEN
jgi:hypothetical protein